MRLIHFVVSCVLLFVCLLCCSVFGCLIVFVCLLCVVCFFLFSVVFVVLCVGGRFRLMLCSLFWAL